MKLDRNNYHRKVENNCHLSSRLKKSGQNYLSPNTRDERFNAGSITSRMLQPLTSQEAPDDMQLVDIQSTPDNQSGRYTFNFWIQISYVVMVCDWLRSKPKQSKFSPRAAGDE